MGKFSEFKTKLLNEEKDPLDTEVKVYERKYKAKKFKDDKSANDFMAAHKGKYGVIKVDGDDIYVADMKDTGKVLNESIYDAPISQSEVSFLQTIVGSVPKPDCIKISGWKYDWVGQQLAFSVSNCAPSNIKPEYDVNKNAPKDGTFESNFNIERFITQAKAAILDKMGYSYIITGGGALSQEWMDGKTDLHYAIKKLNTTKEEKMLNEDLDISDLKPIIQGIASTNRMSVVKVKHENLNRGFEEYVFYFKDKDIKDGLTDRQIQSSRKYQFISDEIKSHIEGLLGKCTIKWYSSEDIGIKGHPYVQIQFRTQRNLNESTDVPAKHLTQAQEDKIDELKNKLFTDNYKVDGISGKGVASVRFFIGWNNGDYRDMKYFKIDKDGNSILKEDKESLEECTVEVWRYDVRGNEEDGYQITDRTKIKTIADANKAEFYTDEGILKLAKDGGLLRDTVHLQDIYIDDSGAMNAIDEGGDDVSIIYYREGNKPIGYLLLVC